MPHKGLQSHAPNQSFPVDGSIPPQKPDAQLSCEAQGGTWDLVGKICIFPKETSTPITTPETITDQETGKKTGIVLPDGRTLLGISESEIKFLIEKDRTEKAAFAGTAPLGTAQRAADLERQRQDLQAGRPVVRQLDPTLQTGEETPVIGPLLTKIRKALGLSAASTSLLDVLKGDTKDEEFFDLQPEELRTAALSEIERQEIERGLTKSERFGEFIEALNVGELKKFIPGAAGAELPSDNVQTVLKSLRILKSRAIDVELKYLKGTLTKAGAEERLNLIDNEIQRGESRMKLLIQNSPDLKFNSDGVNFIELKILEARERSFDSGVTVALGEAGTPQDIDILLALQSSINQESFEIPE